MTIATKLSILAAGSLASALLAAPAQAQEQGPEVPWGVYTVVTTGSRAYGGEKTRAILVYGEIGEPHLTVERIRVVYGSLDESTVLWAEKIDVSGNLSEGEICPPAETWCGAIERLRWEADTLRYGISTRSGASFTCSVTGVAERDPRTLCERS